MYENDSIMRTSRPPGANSFETRLFICLFTRDYEFEKKKDPNLPYVPYIIERFSLMFKPQDPKAFQNLVELEIENSKRYSFITETNELTARGLYFIELSLNGGYMYHGVRFENLVGAYISALAMEGVSSSAFGCEECQMIPDFIPQEPPVTENNKENEPSEVLKVDIPMKDFIFLVNKYKTNSFWNKLKGLLKG